MNNKLGEAKTLLQQVLESKRKDYGKHNAHPISNSDKSQPLKNERQMQAYEPQSNSQGKEWVLLHSPVQQILRLLSSENPARESQQSSTKSVGDMERLMKENESLRRQLTDRDEEIALLKEEVEILSEKGRSYESSHARLLTQMRRKLRQIVGQMVIIRAENKELKEVIQREVKQNIIPSTFQDLQQKLDAYSTKIKDPKEKQILNTLQHQIFQASATLTEHTQIKPFTFQETFKQYSRFTQNLIDFIKTSSFMAESQIVIDRFPKQWLLATFMRQLRFFGRSSTKLLYRYHENQPSKVNFHLYIDKKPNLFVVVKMTNGSILGGFTVYPFDPDNTAKPGQGFLFNLENQLVFPMKEQPKYPVTAYDGYYISFGNSQLRIKSQQLLLYSNFGMSSGTFDPKSSKLSDFMGTNSREEGIQSYEVHQLIYE